MSLEKLAIEADVIFKGTVISTDPVRDEWFKPYPGFAARETRFRVVSSLKGDVTGATVKFHHYDENPKPEGHIFDPQFYHFQTNQTYLVFAKKTGEPAIYRQLWFNHNGKTDQGVLLCLNAKPLPPVTIKDAFWHELTVMLKCGIASNVTYAVRQLDQMSGGGERFSCTQDFDRTNVLTIVHDLMTDSDPTIAQAAITVIGSHNPYLSDQSADYWLATVGTAEIPGLAKMDSQSKNLGGVLYWRDLATIAAAKNTPATRALAIRALGLVREPALREPITRWQADPEPSVRAAATLLLADFPGSEANRELSIQAGDSAPGVRSCAARVIGYSQSTKLVEVLEKLLADPNAEVRRAASVSLLSFSPKNESVASVFQRNLANKEWNPLFLNALARENPGPYLADLARVVEGKLVPENWSGGEIPAFTSWKILFKYLQAQPPDTLKSGKLDRYLDALEKVGNYSSSEPRDIYAFYLVTGMPQRAKTFREKANRAASYDLDYYFKQADQNPSLYKRE